VQAPQLVVESEEQGPDDLGSVGPLPRSPSGDDDIGRSSVLELDLGSQSRLVGTVQRLHDQSVDAGRLETVEPGVRQGWVQGVRRQEQRRRPACCQPFEQSPTLLVRGSKEHLLTCSKPLGWRQREQVECEERCGQPGCQVGDGSSGRL